MILPFYADTIRNSQKYRPMNCKIFNTNPTAINTCVKVLVHISNLFRINYKVTKKNLPTQNVIFNLMN